MADETIKFNPTKVVIGGIRNDATPTTYDGEPAALRLNSESAVVVSVGGSTGTTLEVTGTVADDAAATADAPVKIGAVADSTETAVADGDQVHLITDLYRYLKVVSKAYDQLAGGDKVSNLNTIADDRDDTSQSITSVSNVTAGAHNYPSDDGLSVGNRSTLGFGIQITDGSFDLEVWNGIAWVNITKSLLDLATGTTQHDNTYYASVTQTDWAVAIDHLEFEKYRIVFTATDGTNAFVAKVFTRVI